MNCPNEIDCSKVSELEDEAKQIASPDKTPLERNRDITAAYADLFDTYKDTCFMPWLGAASIASKTVGCAMMQSEAILHVAEQETGFNFPNHYSEFLNAIAGKNLQNALSKGNTDLFRRIYPQHAFFAQKGIEGLKKCFLEKGKMSQAEFDNFQKLSEANDLSANDTLKHETYIDYAKGLAEVEQRTLLANIFNLSSVRIPLGFQGIIQNDSTGILRWLFEGVYMSNSANFGPDCDAKKDEYASITFDGHNLAYTNERVPYAEEGVKTFIDEWNKNRERMQRTLDTLKNRGR